MTHFSLEEVLQILRNVGADVECATCMSVPFTGGCQGEPHPSERETESDEGREFSL